MLPLEQVFPLFPLRTCRTRQPISTGMSSLGRGSSASVRTSILSCQAVKRVALLPKGTSRKVGFFSSTATGEITKEREHVPVIPSGPCFGKMGLATFVLAVLSHAATNTTSSPIRDVRPNVAKLVSLSFQGVSLIVSAFWLELSRARSIFHTTKAQSLGWRPSVGQSHELALCLR